MRFIFFLTILSLCSRGILSQNDDLPWWVLLTTEANEVIIDGVPGNQSAPSDLTEICCECVPFYQCDENNTIITDGGTILAPRLGGANRVFNVETCPDVQQLCCKPKTAPPNCMTSNGTQPQPRPEQPDSTCECLHWEFCLSEFRVSDGSEPSTFIEGDPLPSHAKCLHSLEVCCALETESPIPPQPIPSSPLPGSECICVNPWLCDADNNIITNGNDIMNLRQGAEAPPCMAPKLCCRVPEETGRVTEPTTVKPNRPRDETAPRPEVISDQRCQGIRSPQGISVRIAGFQEGESQFGEFPWVGMVLRTYYVAQTRMNAFIGGAILVHPRVVLTAAHKVAQESVANLTVRVGEWDIETDFEPGAFQDSPVERVIIHPQFNPRNLHHDVALIVLSEPVQLQSHIRSICLAETLEDVDSSACVINGWGKDSFDSGNYQTVMKSVTIPLVEQSRCQSMLRQTRLGLWFELHSSFVCAGGELGKDACSSDGGGPLACPRRGSTTGEYLLVGITAWGIGCGEDGVPGIYASTIADRSWITSQLENIVPDIIHTAVKRDTESSGETTIVSMGISAPRRTKCGPKLKVVTLWPTHYDPSVDRIQSHRPVDISTSSFIHGSQKPSFGQGSWRPFWHSQIPQDRRESIGREQETNGAIDQEDSGIPLNNFTPNQELEQFHYHGFSKLPDRDTQMHEHIAPPFSDNHRIPFRPDIAPSHLQGNSLAEPGRLPSNTGDFQEENAAGQGDTSILQSHTEATRDILRRAREERRRKREERTRRRIELERRRRERRRKHENPFQVSLSLISRILRN